jgi:hypothetical protein
MSALAPRDHAGVPHDEIDLPISAHGAFGVAMVWLAFYALAVVSAIVSYFY